MVSGGRVDDRQAEAAVPTRVGEGGLDGVGPGI
jgi:hypothetical protein